MWCSYNTKWPPNIVSMFIYNWSWQLPWIASIEHITQSINGNEMFNKCFTMYFSKIDLITSLSPHTNYKHSHIDTRPKSKLQDSLHSFYGAGLLLCSQKLNDYFLQKNSTRCNSESTFLLFLILNEAQHVLGDTPPNIRSVRYLTSSNNCTSDNLPRMQNQRLLVQF
jgi:hypothetical protein